MTLGLTTVHERKLSKPPVGRYEFLIAPKSQPESCMAKYFFATKGAGGKFPKKSQKYPKVHTSKWRTVRRGKFNVPIVIHFQPPVSRRKKTYQGLENVM